MSKSNHSSSRQDFIAKVRCSNDLPPPPCPPKLLDYADVKDPTALDTSTFLSSVFRKENFKNLVTLNDDLGMTMNLLKVPDCIEKNSVSQLGPLTPEYVNGMNLHPDDQLLLADPSRSTTVKGEAVSFLRRTQYIAADKTQLPARYFGGAVTSVEATKSALQKKLQQKREEELDPKEQLRAVESMFGNTLNEDEVTSLRHPIKKHMKAKRVWNFLPDTFLMDQKFFDVKFVSSASIRKGKNKKAGDIKSENDPRLLTSMMREIQLNPQTSLVSFYTTTEDNAVEIKKQFEDQTENAPLTEEEAANPIDGDAYTYTKMRDYDGQIKSFDKSGENLRHLAITFDDKTNTALYLPIEGKVELRKCRIDPYLEPKVHEMSYDQIYLSIREPTRAEIDDRDMLRSNFDPMEFGADEEEEEEEEEEKEEEKEEGKDEEKKEDEIKADD
ncbi:DEKNAAC103049 [Brettanomyces naardenensis]|uniref:DEKNAAC103049 n=1 Tax=Brettanomyces naardenensis TaxID=13370 RepID=A0A448YM62_BRENA|nr:DEKNAAC103049 [Brettanomyces naardenensis]